MANANGHNRQMNTLIASAMSAKRGGGLVDRLRATGPLDEGRGTRLNDLLAQYETARRREDHDAAAYADHQIGALLDEARAAHTAPAEPASPPAPGFDGGVRRRSVKLHSPPSMNRTIRQTHAANQAIAANAREWF